MRLQLTAWLVALTALIVPLRGVSAAPAVDVRDDRVTFSFPETATFSAVLTSASDITSVVLEYGDEQQTCGDVIAKAFPQFAPSTTVKAQWVWDMRQSGSLPPGVTIWWRWRFKDESGAEFVSEKQTAVWLDDLHVWKTLSSGDLRLHYYGRDPDFAQIMLDAGLAGLRLNREQAGLVPVGAIDIYVYPNYTDMQEAILYEPSWTGGQAYPDFNIVIMGLSDYSDSWNKGTITHELTHVLVGHFTFSCLGTVPGWVNEGLAVYSEGPLDPGQQSLLDQAIHDNSLISLRSLNGGFSELPAKANLSYSQSYSAVKFLLETRGQAKMTQLLGALRDATPIDAALQEVYGYDTDGLEAAWRKSVGAAPPIISAQATSQPTPTWVPTFVPVSGAPLAVTPTPYAVPTSSFGNSSPSLSNGPPLSLTIALLCLCGLFLLMIGVFVLGFIVRRDSMKRGNHVQE